MEINNFTVIESIYGRFIVNRHCNLQAEALIKTGVPHIQAELNNINRIAATLPDNPMVLDVGANIGLVAVPLARAIKPKSGMVIAFEVQRMMCYALSGTVALNDLDNVIVVQKGLGDEQKWITVNLPNYGVPQDFGLFSLKADFDEPAETVEITTIDALNLPRLDFLKIDVEGMEIEVLNGGRRTIEGYRPWIWVEYWKSDVEQIRSYFRNMDYKLFIADDLNLIAVPPERARAQGVQIELQEI